MAGSFGPGMALEGHPLDLRHWTVEIRLIRLLRPCLTRPPQGPARARVWPRSPPNLPSSTQPMRMVGVDCISSAWTIERAIEQETMHFTDDARP